MYVLVFSKMKRTLLQILRTRSYHSNIVKYFENPQHVGSLGNGCHVYTGLVGAPACGDVLKLQLKIENNYVTEAKFKTFGCGSAIAASSYATELVQGKHVDDLDNITNTAIAKHLKLPPVKLHCSMLAEDAIKNAVLKYRIIQEKRNQPSSKHRLP